MLNPITSLRFVGWLSGAFALLWLTSDSANSSLAADPLPLERRPYQVRTLIAFDHSSSDEALRKQVIHDLEQSVQRCVGELWSMSISEIRWLDPVTRQGLQRVQSPTSINPQAAESADVWFVAAVESLPVGRRVSVRSWQPDVKIQTELRSVIVMDDRDLAIVLLRLCRDLFRPMGVVEQVTDRSVRIRLRAAALTPPDESFTQVHPGDLLVPMLAYRNKELQIERLQMIPWTYISVQEVNDVIVLGHIESGLKLALGGKKRGRIDTMVVAVRPEFSTTRIQLVTQSRPPLPLAAHRLEIRSEAVIPRPTTENPEIDPGSTLLDEKLTDRRGLTWIDVEPDHRLVWLFAYSGQHLLARVPFIPGAAAEIRLDVPDDAARLAAEADLQMLQGEVIDAVALRNTAMSTIRDAARKDDWTTVNQKLALLKQQQSSNTLIDRLVSVRVAGVAAAQARKDKTGQVRINRMCDELLSMIKTHLGDEKVRLLSEEMEALQRPDDESSE